MRFVVGGAGKEPMTLPGRKVKNPLGGLEKTAGVAESQLARTKQFPSSRVRDAMWRERCLCFCPPWGIGLA